MHYLPRRAPRHTADRAALLLEAPWAFLVELDVFSLMISLLADSMRTTVSVRSSREGPGLATRVATWEATLSHDEREFL